MYNILIIDDEEPVREAIRILGDWDGLGINQIMEATDGETALEILNDCKIDIAIVDMKMPEMDGVEFLQVVEQQHPELLTIVISGYNNFEYARQAIRSKVTDYLLKPVNRADLSQALYKAVGQLEAKREQKSEFIANNIKLNMSLPKLKEKIYQSLIDKSYKKYANETLLPLIGVVNPDHKFGVAVIRILNLESIRISRFKSDTNLLHFAVDNIISELTGNDLQTFSFSNPKEEREMIAICTKDSGSLEELSFQFTYLMKQIASNLKDLFGIKILVGMGKPCGNILDIAGSYESGQAAIRTINLLDPNEVVITNWGHITETRDIQSIMVRMPFICNALEAGNLNQARSFIEEFIQKVKGLGHFNLGDTDRMIHEFVILLNDKAIELGVSSEKLPRGGVFDLRKVGIVADIADFEQFSSLLIEILEYYNAVIRKSTSTHSIFDPKDIKDYIDGHYFEDFKVSSFTEKYFLSREYIMKLFKQQYGYGIHEYVQKVRMDKAKELLLESNLKILEISEMLGYKDKNYFSKAFRNYYSISPTEYRMQIWQG
ncbi:response regulator transcription factor [Paenibacillus crassostreae]|uniref:Two-component system response regulator n=1 Tax=Paenibacillus crassostreae TaxID=1763538 RepID=A0A167B847_9BACL|nr:response regulator [Paenibacillus crassostreae]AOZ93088.1 DNA-binding response regulator [Paenibacillus crassostreae]OAB71822.1 two-component system response regulator [Paenibacillus crassostreae]